MTEQTAKHLIGLCLLFGPIVWERADDRYKDLNKKFDVFIRVVIGVIVSIANHYLTDQVASVYESFILSMALHFLLFDYWIAATLGHKDWFNYLGKEGVADTYKPWRNMKPWARLYVRLGVLIIAILIYL